MKKFIVYNTTTGKIERTGQCQDSLFDNQAGVGESVMEGVADDIHQKIIDGNVVDKTQAEVDADKIPDPEPISENDKPAKITNKEWSNFNVRLAALEQDR